MCLRSDEEYGFCGIVGHGIGEELISDAYRAMRNFFALPQEIKERYSVSLGGARGYTSFGIETAKDSNHPDLKEFWQVGRQIAVDQQHHASLFPNVWPEEVSDFRSAIYGLFVALDHLGNRILFVLALYLELPQDYFRNKVNTGNSVLRPIRILIS
jgi:isopenicillin N synthase-like dioxygenase